MTDILRIPVTPDEAAFKVRIALEGRDYVLSFDFNTRMNRWILGVYDAEENPIVVGIALNIDSSILRLYVDNSLPPGEMILFDTSEKHIEGGRNDLGKRCEILYQTSE
jgi:hypothetical protein